MSREALYLYGSCAHLLISLKSTYISTKQVLLLRGLSYVNTGVPALLFDYVNVPVHAYVANQIY